MATATNAAQAQDVMAEQEWHELTPNEIALLPPLPKSPPTPQDEEDQQLSDALYGGMALGAEVGSIRGSARPQLPSAPPAAAAAFPNTGGSVTFDQQQEPTNVPGQWPAAAHVYAPVSPDSLALRFSARPKSHHSAIDVEPAQDIPSLFAQHLAPLTNDLAGADAEGPEVEFADLQLYAQQKAGVVPARPSRTRLRTLEGVDAVGVGSAEIASSASTSTLTAATTREPSATQARGKKQQLPKRSTPPVDEKPVLVSAAAPAPKNATRSRKPTQEAKPVVAAQKPIEQPAIQAPVAKPKKPRSRRPSGAQLGTGISPAAAGPASPNLEVLTGAERSVGGAASASAPDKGSATATATATATKPKRKRRVSGVPDSAAKKGENVKPPLEARKPASSSSAKSPAVPATTGRSRKGGRTHTGEDRALLSALNAPEWKPKSVAEQHVPPPPPHMAAPWMAYAPPYAAPYPFITPPMRAYGYPAAISPPLPPRVAAEAAQAKATAAAGLTQAHLPARAIPIRAPPGRAERVAELRRGEVSSPTPSSG